MPQVANDRPRSNSYIERSVRWRARPLDALPSREGMKRPHRHQKWRYPHEGPLRRWLRSRLGQPWDGIYAEACRVAKSAGHSGHWFRSTILELVHQNTVIREGRVWCFPQCPASRWPRPKLGPVEQVVTRDHPFYLHPVTRVLLEAKGVSRAWAACTPVLRDVDRVRRWVASDRLLLQFHGLWFECQMQAVSRRGVPPACDVALRLPLCHSHATEAYGQPVRCIRKRQLSHAELRQHGLHNAPLDPAACFFKALDPILLLRIRRASHLGSGVAVKHGCDLRSV